MLTDQYPLYRNPVRSISIYVFFKFSWGYVPKNTAHRPRRGTGHLLRWSRRKIVKKMVDLNNHNSLGDWPYYYRRILIDLVGEYPSLNRTSFSFGIDEQKVVDILLP